MCGQRIDSFHSEKIQQKTRPEGTDGFHGDMFCTYLSQYVYQVENTRCAPILSEGIEFVFDPLADDFRKRIAIYF